MPPCIAGTYNDMKKPACGKIIVESKIPFINGLLEPYFDVAYLAPEQVTPKAMADADALITRTRTRCDARLLDASPCRFIATATIGTDHIDLEYCRNRGITVANAPGCNAPAVAQYVLSAIAYQRQLRGLSGPLSEITLGVVGVGHVGSIVVQCARANGINVLCCDPPRAGSGDKSEEFVPLSRIAADCDVITFHTPMTVGGLYATYHLAGSDFFRSLKRKPLLINSARGPVFDTAALLQALDCGQVSDVVVDCWENEPDIDLRLLDRAIVATPHIAGYSLEGKKRATQMALDSVARFFGLPRIVIADSAPDGYPPAPLLETIFKSYSPERDTSALRSAPHSFEVLRNNYAYRPEVR